MSIIHGDANLVDYILFGGPTNASREMIANEHNAFVKSIDPSWGSALVQRTKDLFNAYNDSAAIAGIQNALNHLKVLSKPDMIYHFNNITDMQTAQPVMQAFIMANPVVRRMAMANLCDGYSDTYVDPCPGVIGFGHAQYEQVMNGVVEFKDNGDAVFANYSGAWASETSQVLNISDKAAILNTWYAMDRAFEEGDRDPTSPYNASL